MAQKKNHYYVLVLTDTGAKFVTSTGANQYAKWDGNEKPLDMPQYFAEDVALGLMLNGYMAFCVKNRFEIEHQPYRYNLGHFEWKWNEEKKEGEAV